MASVVRSTALASITALALSALAVPASAEAPEGPGTVGSELLPGPPAAVSLMLELDAEPAARA